MFEIVFVGNDNLLQVIGVKNKSSGAYINDATVTVTVTDESDANVTGQSWPLTCTYISGSNGNYEGTLEDAVNIVAGSTYKAKVTIDGGGGLQGYIVAPLKAATRIR